MRENPHPLALALAERMRETAAPEPRHVLLLGGGLGRNIPPLLEAGLHVDLLDEDATLVQALTRLFTASPTLRILHGPYTHPEIFGTRYNAVLSTHALLHGDERGLAAVIDALAKILRPEAELFLTLGSTRDPRFGQGKRIDACTRVAETGGEKGVPHVYYDEAGVHSLLHAFTLLQLRETSAGGTVGRWAHGEEQTPEIMHWFVHARAGTSS